MTIGEFQRYLIKNGCECKPLEGGNLTGVGLILKKGNFIYIYQIYTGGEPSDTSIKKACDKLAVRYPLGID